MLIFMSYSHSDKKHNHGIYECHCGNITVRRMGVVNAGKNKSCGCLRSDLNRNTDPLHIKLAGMIQRCHNPNAPKYKYYGIRGIKVCDEWRNDPRAFRVWALENGWRPALQIDRIDNDGPYSPSNCRFVPLIDNVRNSRHTKLTMLDALKIRDRLTCGESSATLADEYRVTRACINSIRAHRTWKERVKGENDGA